MVERIWKRIVNNKRLSLWSIPALLLWPVAGLYRLGFLIKRALVSPAPKLAVPVISVGNVAVGGTGKTPMVACVASGLLRDGIRVGIVSSGYRRESDVSFIEPGYRVQNRPTAETGDEVKLLAMHLPEAVFAIDEAKGVAAAKLAETGEVDVIIVDDGFQHFPLVRDIDLVTYDAAVRKYQLKPFPRGVLREPLSALKRADIIVVTRSNFARDIYRLRKRLKRLSRTADVYHAQFSVDELVGRDQRLSAKYLEDKSVLLFAGVGNFRALRKQVAALAADLDYALELSDHQVYDLPLLEKIKHLAREHESDVIVTTGKDWVKLGDFDFGRETYYLNLCVDLDPGEEKLAKVLEQRLGLTPREV